MNIWTIVVAIIAVCGLVYFYPRLPPIGQIIVAVIAVIACLLVLMSLAGVSIPF